MTEIAEQTTTLTTTTQSSGTGSKRKIVELLQSSTLPKAESKGRVSKSFDAEALSLGGGVVFTGKFSIEHSHGNEDDAIKSLMDGTGMKATIKPIAGTKALVWSSDGFLSGNIRENGLTGRESTIIAPPFAFVGATVAGLGSGKGRVHMPNGGVYVGAVENSLPNGIGNMLLNKFLVKGKFIDGKPTGRMVVSNLEDDSSYFAIYEDGVECLEKRKLRKVTSAADYEDDDLELEPEEESVAALKQRLELLQEKIKSAEESAIEAPPVMEDQ
jgi:hypothetical protein